MLKGRKFFSEPLTVFGELESSQGIRMICSNCGTLNISTDRFCKECGSVLSTPQTPNSASLNFFGDAAFQAEKERTDALIGRIIDGRYRLDVRIGTGGMGAVYRATRLNIGDEVAIKILHQDKLTNDPHTVERFRREARAAARLKHPNAVSIYDFGVAPDGLQYLVMDFVEGDNLRQIIKQQGPLTAPVAAQVLYQVSAALDEAHRHHIIHRDVKPDNIIINVIDGMLRVKVLDFGIAKLREETANNLTQTGSVMGTPHYMSPEQCLGEELDGRSDVYSLGIVLYEMLCGAVPFRSPVSTAVVIQHVNQPPPSLREMNIGISPAVETVVMHALEKRREARPQTAGALAQELLRAVHGASIQEPLVYATPSINPATANLESRATHYDDEATLVRNATPATPMSGSVTAGIAPTVHMVRPPVTSGAVAPINRSPATGNYLAIIKSKSGLLIIGTVLTTLVIVGTLSALIWLARSQGNQVTTTDSGQSKDQKESGARVDNKIPPPGMAYVPGGGFLMGTDAGDEYERPKHQVIVKPFFLDLYEVTCEDYKKFVDATGHRAPPNWRNNTYPSGASRRPVTGVNWNDAQAYAKWIEKRLPTEEEWEYAARGTDERRYPWGNLWSAGAANAGKPRVSNIEIAAQQQMENVGGHSNGVSPFGIFDMVGNAWEWTATDLIPYPGGQLPKQLPKDQNAVLKVIRGGCYESTMEQATTTFRRGWPAQGGDEYFNTGFRCARDIASPGNSQ